MRPKVELVAHDSAWATIAQVEAERLAAVLGANHLDVQHIGSTAIPGLKAKPIIDLLPRVRSLNVLDGQADAIKTLGYQWWGEFGIPGRRFFTRDDAVTGARLFNVHAFEFGAAEIDRHLAFRDYLRTHPHESRMYEQEKQRAAMLSPDDVLACNKAKSPWIKACEARALIWWRRYRD